LLPRRGRGAPIRMDDHPCSRGQADFHTIRTEHPGLPSLERASTWWVQFEPSVRGGQAELATSRMTRMTLRVELRGDGDGGHWQRSLGIVGSTRGSIPDPPAAA